MHRLPPLSSHIYHTQACGISSVRCFVQFAALSDRHCLRCHGCFCCCPPCANCCTAPFPPMYPALSSPASCCRYYLHALLLLVHSFEQDVGIDPSQVEDVIEDHHWPSSRTAFDEVCPRHLVQDVHAVLAVVIVYHRLVLPSPH